MIRCTTYDRARFNAGLALGIGSAAGSIVSSIYNTNATNRANREIMREQNEWNKKMWELNNEYNSPVMQRQRMEAAGLNPNLFDMDSGTSSSPAVAASSAEMLPNNVPSEALLNFALQQSQVKLNEANAAKAGSETDLNEIEKKFREDILAGTVEQQGVTIANIKASTDLTYKECRELQGKIEFLNKELDSYDQKLNATLGEIAARTNLANEQATTEGKSREVMDSTIRNNDANTRYTDTQNSLAPGLAASANAANYAAAENNRATAENTREQTKFFKLVKKYRAKAEVYESAKAFEEYRSQLADSTLKFATIGLEIAGARVRLETDKANMKTAITIADYNEAEYGSVAEVTRALGPLGKFLTWLKSQDLSLGNMWQNTNGSVNAAANMVDAIVPGD